MFDVGANRGEWAKIVLARKPDSVIYCFEIVPASATLLRDGMAGHPGVHICDYGLSSSARETKVFWNRASDHESGIAPPASETPLPNSEIAIVTSRVETGDAVMARTGLARIDLLKIDVEGHEMEVLTGFRDTLASRQQPRVIQFEYGPTWLPPRHTLMEAYRLLEPQGYVIGRLYPDGVDFKPYELADDHFRMGNYIAVLREDSLLDRLTRFGPAPE